MGALPIALALAEKPQLNNSRPNGGTLPHTGTPQTPLVNHSSTPTLYPLEKVGKTASVTSLSVGVQYDPRDVKDNSRNHLRYNSENEYIIPGDGLRRGLSAHHRKTHFHLSGEVKIQA